MTIFKVFECVGEAVPGSIVQIYALILAQDKNWDAFLSIVVSASTIAFTSSMISYDFDTSPNLRVTEKLFYGKSSVATLLICLHNFDTVLIIIGYIPDKYWERGLCFLSLMTFSFAHVLLQTFSCALLAVMDPSWVFYYIAADMTLFFLYKLTKKDFHTYINLSGLSRLNFSFFERFFIKIMLNFTLMVQLRHPQEVGGAPFLMSIMTSLAVSVGAAYTYENDAETDADGEGR